MHQCPEVITKRIWQHVISLTVDVRTKHKISKEGCIAIERLSRISQPVKIKDNNTFSCPACALNASLQDKPSLSR